MDVGGGGLLRWGKPLWPMSIRWGSGISGVSSLLEVVLRTP